MTEYLLLAGVGGLNLDTFSASREHEIALSGQRWSIGPMAEFDTGFDVSINGRV